MISPSVVVLDYGSGNIHSAAKALELAGARVSLSSEKSVAEAADGLLVPGVGAFSAVMAGINSVRGGAAIEKRPQVDRRGSVVRMKSSLLMSIV